MKLEGHTVDHFGLGRDMRGSGVEKGREAQVRKQPSRVYNRI